MIIVMASRDKADVDHVVARVEEFGYKSHVIEGVERTVIAAVGDEREKYRLQSLEALPHVEKVVPILEPYKLAGREVRPEPTVISCGSVRIGGGHFAVIGGPCSVESREQILTTAEVVKRHGGHMLRGGAYKPRTSPYSFQGLEEEGLKLLREAGDQHGLPVVTEAMTPEQVPLVAKYADMLQIGARNMQNYGLLKEAGKTDKPVFLKRGMMSTIRTFETETRNVLDIQAVPALKRHTHLPVVVDPSHASGQWDLVIPMARAAVAAGADGLMVEVHPKPEDAFSDGPQSLKPERFEEMMKEIAPFLETMHLQAG